MHDMPQDDLCEMCASFSRENFLGSTRAGVCRGLLRAGELQLWGRGELGEALGIFGERRSRGRAVRDLSFAVPPSPAAFAKFQARCSSLERG